MAICEKCGAAVQEGKPFCSNCGANMDAEAMPAPPMPPENPNVPPERPRVPPEKRQAPPAMFYPGGGGKPPKGTRYAPMGVGAFLGMFLLLLIPLVNIILLIVWACGGCTNQNKRNYARAMLILCVIILILDIALLTLLVTLGYLTPETFFSITSSLPA